MSTIYRMIPAGCQGCDLLCSTKIQPTSVASRLIFAFSTLETGQPCPINLLFSRDFLPGY
ncbi:hypothetical protein [Pseudomonas sp. P5_C3]